MPRKYTHVQLLEDEFIRLREEGYTRREIADMFGLDEIQVKNALYRHKKRMETISAPPRSRASSSSDSLSSRTSIRVTALPPVTSFVIP